MAKAGRKKKCTPELIQRLYDLASKDDYTDKDLYTMLGIGHDSFYRYKNEIPEFSETLKKAENKRNEELKHLARSGVRKLLTGYEYEEVTTEGKPDKNGKFKATFVKKVKKHIPPNSTITIFTLKNLDADNFNVPDKHEHSGNIINIDWSE